MSAILYNFALNNVHKQSRSISNNIFCIEIYDC